MLSPMNNEQLGVNLMVDYVDWVDRDYADTSQSNWRGVLSSQPLKTTQNIAKLQHNMNGFLLQFPSLSKGQGYS
jgi:hypothetical protein